MADFDDFAGDNQNNAAFDDPAADFLAREQSELAGLDNDEILNEVPTQNNDDFDSYGGGGYEDFGQSHAQDYYTNDGDLGDYLNGGGLLDSTPTSESIFDPPKYSSFATNGPSDGYSAIAEADQLRAEPETIKKWREEQKKRLETKDAEEANRKDELLQKARKELDDWYRHHAEQLDKTKASNRAAEKALVAERDETAPGHEWERVCRLCEFNPKFSKSTKDVSRLRSILLQLKQTPLSR